MNIHPLTEAHILALEQEVSLLRAALSQGQPRHHSAWETISSTFIGFSISTAANYFLLPLWGYSPSISASIEIGILFTAISLFRGYVIRRFFNYIHTSRFERLTT